jgi:hypothetical protein
MRKGLPKHKHKSIIATYLEQSKDNRINPTDVHNEKVAFSLKHLVRSEKFDYQHHKLEVKYFWKVLERLKDLSALTALEIRNSRDADSLRCHKIDWGKTTEKSFGIKELESTESHQFQISSNEYGRVHGFFIGHIFYIVWFDPFHKLSA